MSRPNSKSLNTRITDYPVTVSLAIGCALIEFFLIKHPLWVSLFLWKFNYLLHVKTFLLGLLTLVSFNLGHAGVSHLTGNFLFMLPFLFFFEHREGPKRLFWTYFLTGIGGGLFYSWWMGGDAMLIGSSGSAFGVAAASCLLFGRRLLDKGIAVLFFSILFYTNLIAMLLHVEVFTNVGYAGHIGSALAGVIAAIFLSRLPKNKQ